MVFIKTEYGFKTADEKYKITAASKSENKSARWEVENSVTGDRIKLNQIGDVRWYLKSLKKKGEY